MFILHLFTYEIHIRNNEDYLFEYRDFFEDTNITLDVHLLNHITDWYKDTNVVISNLENFTKKGYLHFL